jgi:hypothetical protein
MRYVFHPEAEVEFFAAIDYYEDREQGLGYDFAIEVHSTIDTILVTVFEETPQSLSQIYKRQQQ